MMVMPANNWNAYRLEKEYPGRIGMLFGPSSWRPPKDIKYALDNDRFSVWSSCKKWNASDFQRFLDKAVAHDREPLWCVVPDCVGDAASTFEWWHDWKNQLNIRGIAKALAVQDGMTPECVRRQCTDDMPDIIFVGGTTYWKRSTLWGWCRNFPRVHVGRVNTEKWLWQSHKCGAESVDGTGFFRGDQRQLRGLLRYLKRSNEGLGPVQKEFEFAGTMSCQVNREVVQHK